MQTRLFKIAQFARRLPALIRSGKFALGSAENPSISRRSPILFIGGKWTPFRAASHWLRRSACRGERGGA